MIKPLLLSMLAPLLLATAQSAWAHGLEVACRIKGERVRVEAFFDDDSPASRASVLVRGEADDVDIASGETDDQGIWWFSRPAPGAYTVIVDAGAGHRVKRNIVVPVSELPKEVEDVISDGLPREEFTRFPWLPLLLGVLIIAALGGGFMIVGTLMRNRRSN